MRDLKPGILFSVIALAVAAAPASGQDGSAITNPPSAGAPGLEHDITLTVPLSPEVDPAIADDVAYIVAAGWLAKGPPPAVDGPADAATKTPRAAATETAPLPVPDSADATPEPPAMPGEPEESYALGLALVANGAEADAATAINAFRIAAEAGIAGAQFELGWAYETGRGTDASIPDAVRWYEKAAAAGEARAMNNLGWLLAQGQGLPRDVARALALYTEAANAGEASAMGNLAWMMENGIGMAQDLDGAARWYRRAADAGDTQAMLSLGNLYLVGDGVTQDTSEAIAWFARARAAGRVEALSYIGEVFEKSPDRRDPDRAAGFYLRALESGDNWPETRASAAWDGDTAIALQRLLAARALYSGPLDGKVGPGTRAAMRRLRSN
ncbi:tetratricopeptide repeat protein [Sinisalibacter aestuarii]|uniref:Sel1 repeat family protein n=1 Tax=Sinisalibacter aestuarii TaxID=2949426 RepID=A0ABQ5LUT5_9RHOB|nr:tetratricopeptide repeat protein [Sinisalibacter aestuarii]GKY88741.1 hypothetical protein STA1M1_26100 [Sinisalibacter aestuarii]